LSLGAAGFYLRANATDAVWSALLASDISGILTVAHGGNGTATPAITAGSGITIGGAWPAQSVAWTTPVTTYNAIATVSNGVPAEYATVDLTAQAAAITATTLYAVPASGAGMYRISWVATVTQAASVSSVLGGTNGFQIVYTDSDTSVVKTMPGTIVAGFDSNATNSTATGTISGTFVVFAKASTNIQYQIDYSSTGVTPMQFNLHVKLEAL
jgi:hypothetical protein